VSAAQFFGYWGFIGLGVLFIIGCAVVLHFEGKRMEHFNKKRAEDKQATVAPHADTYVAQPNVTATEVIASCAAIEPIAMILLCPNCGTRHIDKPEPCMSDFCESGCVQPLDCVAWTNPPHRSHKCQSCEYQWRPADVCTTGVAALKTRGEHDAPMDGAL